MARIHHRRLASTGSLLAATLVAGLLVALPAGASGLVRAKVPLGTEPPPPAVPHPFGRLTCAAESYGVRFCEGNGTTERVPSFDGVPLDADVTLPAKGRGPFPLMVLLHGWGGNKTNFESTSTAPGFDNVTYARHGFAVLTYSARGFGNSCGSAASRAGTPACARGWSHLADQRYEIRDTQYLAGLLVDEGLVTPAIGVGGISYGGGQSLELAMMKNRVRLLDGRYAAWVSPVHHVPMSVGAAFAMWGWDDLVTALDPNGNLSDLHYTRAAADLTPAGIDKQSWNTLLYNGAAAAGYLAPVGADPSADLTAWYRAIGDGEPYSPADESYLAQLEEYHSAIGISMPAGGPAPVVMQNGWTDTLFPVSEALHFSERYAADHVSAPLLQIFDDVGHGWAQNKAADVASVESTGLGFVEDELISHTTPPTGVEAVGTTCPSSSPSGPEVRASSWSSLPTVALTATSAGAQFVTSSGGSAAVAADLNPAYVSTYCHSFPATREPGTALYTVVRASSSNRVLLGALHLSAHLRITGDFPEVIGRLWDVDPATRTRQLVEAGAFRPPVNQAKGTTTSTVGSADVSFELESNMWTLPAHHELALELVGSSAPWFRRSNGTFSIRVTDLTASIDESGI